MEITDRDVEVRSGNLYVRDRGDGPAIVFLHAFPLNSRMWEAQLDSFADGARVIAPDLPGFGLSPLVDESASIDVYARRVLEAVDRFEVETFTLVGLSLGGYVAFRMIDLAPTRVTGLVLADTKATPDDDAQRTIRHRLAAEVEANGVDVLADELMTKLLGPTTMRRTPWRMDMVRAMIRESTPGGLAAALRALASRPDSSPLLPSITCPVACIVGAEDAITSPSVMHAMAERIPRAVTIVIPGVGHLSSIEAPEEFDRAVATVAVGMRS